MLINDFLKFSSAASPKDSLVKMPINRIFMVKISRKNGQDSLTKNSGISMDVNDVATIHEKIIFFKLNGFTAWLIVRKPASSYSLPYFSISNQKCGICQINRKKAMKTIVLSNR